MSNIIKTDFHLDHEAKSLAVSIFEEFKDSNGGESFDAESFRDEMTERAWEYCDASQHVIYTARAIAICGNCNTDDGESWLEDIYGKPFADCDTFGEVCTRLAFAELHCRVIAAMDDLISEWEPKEEEEESQE